MNFCLGYQMTRRMIEYSCLLVTFNTFVSSLITPPPHRCSDNKHIGTSMCDFNIKNCYQENSNDTLAWEVSDLLNVGPVQKYEGRYIYLNPALSAGTPKKLLGRLPANVVAVCFDIVYATGGTLPVPIDLYIENGNAMQRVHQITARTEGEWETTQFACCLPNFDRAKQFAIEATSTDDGIPAIDHVNIRYSYMPCENGELVCYPRVPDGLPLDSDASPQCPSALEETAVPSCEFNANDQKTLADCGWEVSPDWLVRQKIDGSGEYDIITADNDFNSTLLCNIADDVIALCVEIQFAVPLHFGENFENVFLVYILLDSSTSLWGAAYNYNNSNISIWKRNSFDEFLPAGTNRHIQLSSHVKGLKIDYIRVRTSDKSRTTPPPQTTPVEWVTLFSCPSLNSVEELLPFCGMTQATGTCLNTTLSLPVWTEVESVNATDNIFPGREYYLLYGGAKTNLTQANLTTGYIKNDQGMTLRFSYALSGDVQLLVSTVENGQAGEHIWSTRNETGGTWVSTHLTFKSDEPFRLVFSAKLPSPEINLKVPSFVGLTDIVLIAPMAFTPTSTTLAANTTTVSTEPTDEKKFEGTDSTSQLGEIEIMIVIGAIIFFIVAVQIAGLIYHHIEQNRSDSDPEC